MAESNEGRIARALYKALDVSSLDPNWVVFSFTHRAGSAMQRRIYDLLVAFVRYWALEYTSGKSQPQHALYSVHRTAHKITTVLPSDIDGPFA